MKTTKSYSNIWNVDRVLYRIMDWDLPFPITFNQAMWGAVSLLLVVVFSKLPPLIFIDNILLKYILLPVLIAFLMSKKQFDKKSPLSFFRSLIGYYLSPKLVYMGKPIVIKKEKLNYNITVYKRGGDLD